MSETNEIEKVLEHLFHVRKKLSKYRAYEESLKMNIQDYMESNGTDSVESSDFICYKQIKTHKNISKKIPAELIEPYYEYKTYPMIKVIQKK